MAENSDEQLIKQYLSGDSKSFNFLIERYLKRVYNFTVRYIGNAKEAEDLTQEIFLKVWRGLKRFDQKKSFRAWLWRIVRNTCVDYLRRKKMLVFSALENEDDQDPLAERIADTTESIVEKIDRQELAKEVEEYLMKLSEQSRAVLLLHYNQQMTFQEIADSLGESVDTVKSRHQRALIALKRIMLSNKMHQN